MNTLVPRQSSLFTLRPQKAITILAPETTNLGKGAYHVEKFVQVLVVPAKLEVVVSPDHALRWNKLKW